MKESIKLITLAVIDMDIKNLLSLIKGESDENKIIYNPWTGNENRCGSYRHYIRNLVSLKARILENKLIPTGVTIYEEGVAVGAEYPDDYYIESYLTWFKDLLEEQIKYIKEGNNIYDNKVEK